MGWPNGSIDLGATELRPKGKERASSTKTWENHVPRSRTGHQKVFKAGKSWEHVRNSEKVAWPGQKE